LFSHVVCKLEDRDEVANTEAETHDQIDSHRPRFYNGRSMIVIRMGDHGSIAVSRVGIALWGERDCPIRTSSIGGGRLETRRFFPCRLLA
jgi:hypothetical protein